MKALELSIPPPVVGLLAAIAMWGTSLLGSPVGIPYIIRLTAALAIGLVGVGLALSGARLFRLAKTTIHPTNPEKTSSLVTSGIYRFTRNPMYLGITLVLLAWAIYLSSPWVLGGPIIFVLYISRFQIIPEERILAAKFGADYAVYRSVVRRWL